MKNLIIFGTGEFAVECYFWLQDMMEKNNDLIFKGFLSTNNDLEKNSPLLKYYLGNEHSYVSEKDDYFVVAIAGNLTLKQKIVSILNKKNVKYFNLVHPTAIIKTKNLGEGNIFAPYTIVSYDAKILNHNSFNCYTSIGHHAEISSFNAINSHCDITGHCKVSNSNFFGSSVVMLPNSIIGNNNKIAASTVIYKKFRDNSLISGNPAIKIGDIK